MRFCAGLTVVTISLEMVAIVGQATRGQGSHFNHHGVFDVVVSASMGATIAVFFLGAVTLAVITVRSGRLDPLTRRAITSGVLPSLGGMLAGIAMSVHGAHSVGARDGGPGLPFTGWSTVVGDLRIPHFIGLHGLELLPLFAFGLQSGGRGHWSTSTQLKLQAWASTAYAGVFVILFAQALCGESVVRPRLLTLLAFGVLVAVTATGVVRTLRPSAAIAASPVSISAPVR